MANLFQVLGFNSGLGLGNYSDVTAFEMIGSVSQATLSIVTDATAAFYIRNGCSSFYAGMHDYIGNNSVILGADIKHVKRFHEHDSQPNRVKVLVNGVKHKYFCDRIVVAFPPVLDEIGFLKPDALEKKLFKHVRTNYYYAGVVQPEGPLEQQGNFLLQNTDLDSIFWTPFVTAPTVIGRTVPYGPAQTQTVATHQTDINTIQELARQNFLRIPDTLLTNATTLLLEYQHGSYGPHFTLESLGDDPSPYAVLNDLQGHRRTYWTSALNSVIASTTQIWEHNNRMWDAVFD